MSLHVNPYDGVAAQMRCRCIDRDAPGHAHAPPRVLKLPAKIDGLTPAMWEQFVEEIGPDEMMGSGT